MPSFEPAAHEMAALVAGVCDEQLDAPTPCAEYTVGDLLDHIVGVARAFAAAGAKERGVNTPQPPPGNRSLLGDDWRTRIPRELRTLPAAWNRDDSWDGVTWIGGMEMPAEVVGRVGIDELVVHGWDLARATSQAFSPDRASVAASLEFLEPMSQPGMDAARQPAFGAVVEPAAGAVPLERVIALSGRDPSWSAR